MLLIVLIKIQVSVLRAGTWRQKKKNFCSEYDRANTGMNTFTLQIKKNPWTTDSHIKVPLYRLHSLPVGPCMELCRMIPFSIGKLTSNIKERTTVQKGVIFLWMTFSTHMQRHTCIDSLSLSLALLEVVRGPYCVSQRKCRHSRGQAIHWSEYRLLSFSCCYPTLSLLFSPCSTLCFLCPLCYLCFNLLHRVLYSLCLPVIYHPLFLYIIAFSLSLSLSVCLYHPFILLLGAGIYPGQPVRSFLSVAWMLCVLMQEPTHSLKGIFPFLCWLFYQHVDL